MTAPAEKGTRLTVERTLAIIKPDAWPQHGGEIITMATRAGLVPVEMAVERNSGDVWREFYGEHQSKPFFEPLCAFMSSGPVLAMALEGEGAVAKWRALMGPTDSRKAGPATIRGQFGEQDPAICPSRRWRGVLHWFVDVGGRRSASCFGCGEPQEDIEREISAYPIYRNAVHGSDSVEAAKREIAFFFNGGI